MTPEEQAVIDAAVAWVYGDRDPRLDDHIVAAVEEMRRDRVKPLEPEPIWVESTMSSCLTGDRIRMGSEQTTVLFSNRTKWSISRRREGWWVPTEDGGYLHSDQYSAGSQPCFPAKVWTELKMELEAIPERRSYPPNAAVEILCTPERLATLRIQEAFVDTEQADV